MNWTNSVNVFGFRFFVIVDGFQSAASRVDAGERVNICVLRGGGIGMNVYCVILLSSSSS